MTSDEIVSTLMGEQVEPRRELIESNALGVRNLDVWIASSGRGLR